MMVDFMETEIKKARIEARALVPAVRIGKNGLTESAVAEIVKLLKKRRVLKIKMLNSFTDGNDRKKAAEELAEKCNAWLVEQVGGIVVLLRKPAPKPKA